MKVLVANDLYGRSSAAGVAVRLAEGVAAQGIETTFLATVQTKEQARRFRERGVDVRVEYTPAYDGRWRAWKSLQNPAGVAAMRQAVAEVRPDIVHVHNLHIHLSYAALAAAKAGGARTVLPVHGLLPGGHQKMVRHLDGRLRPGDPGVHPNG